MSVMSYNINNHFILVIYVHSREMQKAIKHPDKQQMNCSVLCGGRLHLIIKANSIPMELCISTEALNGLNSQLRKTMTIQLRSILYESKGTNLVVREITREDDLPERCLSFSQCFPCTCWRIKRFFFSWIMSFQRTSRKLERFISNFISSTI